MERKIQHFLGCVLGPEAEQIKYTWVGRAAKHTPEEIEKGRQENSNLVVMSAAELGQIVDVEPLPGNEDTVMVFWPKKNGLSIGTSLCFPAYTQGVEGDYVEIQLPETEKDEIPF